MKVYDIAGDCSLVNTFTVYVDNDMPSVIPVRNATYDDRIFFLYEQSSSNQYSDIYDVVTGERYVHLRAGNTVYHSGYNIAFEWLDDNYLLTESSGGGGIHMIPGESGDDTIRAYGWHDWAVPSADNKYIMYMVFMNNTHYSHGFRISRLFYESIEKIKSIPLREGAARYVAFFTKDLIKYDEKHLELLLRELYKVNAKVVFFGDDDSRIVGEELANATGGIFMEYTDYDDALAKLDNYIKSRAAADTEKESEIALLLNEEYIIESDCYDYENDTIIAEEWLYEHDPAYFENSLGLAPYHLVPQAGPRSSFQHTGLFKTTARVQDRPKADARFSNYWLWSLDTDPLWLYVHRWPVADVEIHAQNPQDELGENKFKRGAPLVLTNNSYDPDAQSRPDRG
ncbi:MAG: hypothetical protein QME73_06890, partial [Bacillota bacterium]|nr:hypothetical protein [Bacillota bacterium]